MLGVVGKKDNDNFDFKRSENIELNQRKRNLTLKNNTNKDKDKNIIILGPSGVCKTRLFNWISSSNDKVSNDESEGTLSVSTKTHTKFKITDTPGCQDKFEWWKELSKLKDEYNYIIIMQNGTNPRSIFINFILWIFDLDKINWVYSNTPYRDYYFDNKLNEMFLNQNRITSDYFIENLIEHPPILICSPQYSSKLLLELRFELNDVKNELSLRNQEKEKLEGEILKKNNEIKEQEEEIKLKEEVLINLITEINQKRLEINTEINEIEYENPKWFYGLGVLPIVGSLINYVSNNKLKASNNVQRRIGKSMNDMMEHLGLCLFCSQQCKIICKHCACFVCSDDSDSGSCKACIEVKFIIKDDDYIISISRGIEWKKFPNLCKYIRVKGEYKVRLKPKSNSMLQFKLEGYLLMGRII